MSRWKWLLLLILVAAVGYGCGQRTVKSNQAPAPDRIKAILEAIVNAKPGGPEKAPAGSSVGSIFPAVEELKKTHPEQAQGLEKDAKELMSLTMTRGVDSPQAKAKAQQMLKTLESVK